MKLLIVGAGSAVGKALITQLQERQIEYFAPEPKKINARDPLSIARVITRCSPDQVINLGSYAAGSQLAVHLAEENPIDCEAVNHEQASALAQVCDHLNIPLIHLSSAYVFSGEKKLPYNEQDVTKPVGIYGKTELLGERAIIKTAKSHVILRTGWLFGPGQDESIRRWVEEVKQNDGAVSVLRRRFCPTPVEDAARVLLALSLQVDCQASVWGIYHYCALETPRENEFVQQVFKTVAQHDESVYRLLDHITITQTRVSAPDISNSTLASKKIFETFAIRQHSWHGSLQQLVKSWYQDK